MSDTALSAEISSTFAAIAEQPGIGAADPVGQTIAEVEDVIGAYRSPEQIAAEEAAIVKADEARAAEYRQPPTVAPEQLGKALWKAMPVTASGLGELGMNNAARAMSAIPRDVLEVADAAGALNTGRSWALLADIGQALAGQPKQLDPAPQHEFTADDVRESLGGRLDGLPADAADALALLLNGLPPAVLDALDAHADDDDLLQLGVLLGRKLWGYEPPSTRKAETMTTTRRPPANADDLVRQAKKLQASDAYANTADPDHAKVRATVRRIYETAYPQPAESGQ